MKFTNLHKDPHLPTTKWFVAFAHAECVSEKMSRRHHFDAQDLSEDLELDAHMQRLERDEPLPTEMQGAWIGADDPTSELIIEGSEITCFGQVVAHDYKEISYEDGAIIVNLKVNDPTKEDTFQRTNITGLVLTSDGEFHAYNVKFGVRFVRRLPA